jgi:predicted dehydrogenase
MTLNALDHGKHVICEKPLALDVKEATEMVNKAEKEGLIHMTVFNWRFVPAIFRMKELIEKGEVGSIRHVSFSWLNDESRNKESRFFWRFMRSESGFGALGVNGVHGIDLIQWIFGDFRRVVSHMAIHVPKHRAERGVYKEKDVEDSCSFLGELTTGAQVIFHVSTVAVYDSLMRLEVHGDAGVLGANLSAKAKDYYGRLLGGKGENSLHRVIPIPKRLKWDTVHINYGVTPRVLFFKRFAQQLVTAVKTGQTPSPSFFDGLKAQKIIQALIMSWEKKEWLNLI